MNRQVLSGALLLLALAVLWRTATPALHALRDYEGLDSNAANRVQPEPAAQRVAAGPALRVLFVGNSHTYYNDMPQLIGGLARGAKQARNFEFEMIVAGGATLQQHLDSGAVQDRLNRGRWDWLVVQEQQLRPTFTFNRPVLEREFFAPVRTFDVLARAAGAKLLLYMPWARRAGDPDNVPGDDYEHMQARSLDSHSRIATELQAPIAAVGTAWRWAHQQQPGLPLWDADGMHPARHGSFLAACVLYSMLYGSSPLDIAYDAELPPADAAFLRKAAEVARHL